MKPTCYVLKTIKGYVVDTHSKDNKDFVYSNDVKQALRFFTSQEKIQEQIRTLQSFVPYMQFSYEELAARFKDLPISELSKNGLMVFLKNEMIYEGESQKFIVEKNHIYAEHIVENIGRYEEKLAVFMS